MARKKDSPQKAALRELMGNYLKENNVKVKDGTDVNSIMRDMMSIILEGALDQELDEELGYSKDNWANLSTYFKYPEAVRRLIYTTNTMEGFNRQLRKVTKSKTVFPSDDSLLKMLYLAMIDITKKSTGHRKDWGQIHSQLEIFFEERLSGL